MQKNRIELAGYLAAKAECRYLPSGTKVANARLGESYRYRDHEGKQQSHTNWHSLTFYDELADVALLYEQGENIYVEGTIQQRKFTPKDGVTRTVHEVVVRSCHSINPAAAEARAAAVARNGGVAGGKVPEEGEPLEGTWPV